MIWEGHLDDLAQHDRNTVPSAHRPRSTLMRLEAFRSPSNGTTEASSSVVRMGAVLDALPILPFSRASDRAGRWAR